MKWVANIKIKMLGNSCQKFEDCEKLLEFDFLEIPWFPLRVKERKTLCLLLQYLRVIYFSKSLLEKMFAEKRMRLFINLADVSWFPFLPSFSLIDFRFIPVKTRFDFVFSFVNLINSKGFYPKWRLSFVLYPVKASGNS